jgi:SNF2 family DNA or RNA helicase
VAEIVAPTNPVRGRVIPNVLLLADEMRCGKTRTAIDAAQELWRRGEVDQVIVVAPASVRSEWADEKTGQIHEYADVPTTLLEYRTGKSRTWELGTELGLASSPLRWVATNYELIRRKERLEPLLERASPKTMLVLDESAYVSSPTAQQTKAVYRLRQRCGRVLELNGTPWGDNPGDIYAQMKILSPDILGCRTWTEFRAKYAVMVPRVVHNGNHKFMEVVAWTNLDDLNKRVAPYVLRRTMAEVFPDMPPALDPVTLTATLTDETWRVYREMRDEAVAFLESGECASAAQATARVLRLAQITSGFVGGIECHGCLGSDDPDCQLCHGVPPPGTRELSREKLGLVLGWVDDRMKEDHNFKTIVWCRFRLEAERVVRELQGVPAMLLYGGQKPAVREAVKAALHPRSAGPGPLVVVGTARTGGLGLNFAAASTMLRCSNDFSLMTYQQSAARILGPDQKFPAAYFDVVAEGPRGQKTVDHHVIAKLRAKEDVAGVSARAWASILKDE